MVQREVPGTTITYELVSIDADGGVRDQEEVKALCQRLARSADSIRHVYFLVHGWNNDLGDSEESYTRWLRAVAQAFPEAEVPSSVRFVCLHWPSKAWGSETGVGAGQVLGASAGQAVTAEQAKDTYAKLLGVPADALTEIIEAAAHDYNKATLSPSLRRSFEAVRDAMDLDGIEDGSGAGEWDPGAAWKDLSERSLTDLGLDASAGPAAVLGGGGGGRILGLLRQLSFWRMKKRARVVGEKGAANVLSDVIRSVPSARVSLMGHSMGAIVACAAVDRSSEVSTAKPVQSLFLVQGAFSMWAFDDSIPVAGGVAGYFRGIIDQRLVAGPILVTRSEHDHAVGTYYPMAARLARSVILAAGGKYGAIGAYGAIGLDGASRDLVLHQGGGGDTLDAGCLYNVEASNVIRELRPVEGAHNDIARVELARLAIAAATA